MNKIFPRTTIETLSVSRMVIGTNWFAGWSHTGPAADKMIQRTHSAADSIVPVLECFQAYGVDTIMGPFSQTPVICDAIARARDKTGKDFIMIDTPIINVQDSAAARQEARQVIEAGRRLGAQICLIHHSSAEQLVDKGRQVVHRLDDYTRMIRDAGMVPGLSAHMPELVVYSDKNEYDVQTYLQIYNCMGFMMQVEVETVNQIIHDAKKPVIAIKPMAAGRCTPFVGLNFSWATIREQDMVALGCLNEGEAQEDIEISFAALEHRRVNLEKRSSPNQKQDAFGTQ